MLLVIYPVSGTTTPFKPRNKIVFLVRNVVRSELNVDCMRHFAEWVSVQSEHVFFKYIIMIMVIWNRILN